MAKQNRRIQRQSKASSKKPKPAPKGPILLSGGNPQIAKGYGDAPVQTYIAAMPGWKRDAGRRLDALIVRTLPGVQKAVKWNSPLYGVEGQGWFLGIHCFAKYIKLAFFRGASLRPVPPVESKDEHTRYFHIHEDDQLDEAMLASWIRQASELPGWREGSSQRTAVKESTMPGKTSKKSAKVATKAAGKRVAAKAVKPRKAVARSSANMGASRRIDKKIADLGDWRGERLAQIRRLIHEVDPDVVEEWKWMGSPVWSHDGMYALANPHKGKVKLTFFHGARLPDPRKLFNAGLEGDTWRAIDFRETDTIDETALKALLREAVAYNTSHPVPKSKGSRA